ncbi:MAG: FGGY-family carbohydrate kinase [Chloroflexi bacterium]|nr:FGGY-family carbohydrate kinase [Chloroflexota bacterium]
MGELLLGVDVGTYSTKGVLVTPDGKVLKSHIVEHTMDIPRPGWAEQDADAIWWHDVAQVCRALLDGAPYTGEDVAGVGLSAIGPCMLPLDQAGRPVRKGILYGIDTRAGAQIAKLNASLGEERVFAFSKMAFTSQAIGPKILWMRENEPELWEQMARITTASSYLVFRMTGEHVIDRHTASHYMPLVDMETLEWSTRYADSLVAPSYLPRLAWSDEVAGTVHSSAAQETGLKVGTPVAVGAVDALSEAISVGVTQPGDMMIMYGSTTFFIIVLEAPVPDPRVWTTGGARQGQYNLAAGMATTGALTRWFRDTLAADLGENAYGQLFEQAASVPAGANGLLMLPYFSGERTPINDPQARGIFAGLTLSHSRADLFRAVLEGVAFGIRHNIETFQAIGAPVDRIVAVGGGTQSQTWVQVVSDITDVPQTIPALTIGASYGDAFLAGVAAGNLRWADLSAWVKPGQTIIPQPAHRETYDRLYTNYLQLYVQTRDVIHQLGTI